LWRLFCFPYAGGSASIYNTWPADLPPTVDVCAIQLPGRENRLFEPPLADLFALVETLAEVLSPYLTLPGAFFGHSMGALIGFELARYLSVQARFVPARLFVSAHRAPQLPGRRPSIHTLPDAALLLELQRFQGASVAAFEEEELMELMLPALRADFTVCETYRYTRGLPLTCPISVFGGRSDRDIRYTELAAWREQTSKGFALRVLPGDHFFLHSQRAAVLQSITEDLAYLR
jgi:medium-chain acyl-[acyl-carrier-protein] hydrolase